MITQQAKRNIIISKLKETHDQFDFRVYKYQIDDDGHWGKFGLRTSIKGNGTTGMSKRLGSEVMDLLRGQSGADFNLFSLAARAQLSRQLAAINEKSVDFIYHITCVHSTSHGVTFDFYRQFKFGGHNDK